MKLLCAPWKAVSLWSHLFLVACPPHILSIVFLVPATGYFIEGRWLQRTSIRHSSAIAYAIAIAICSSAIKKAVKKAGGRGGAEESRGTDTRGRWSRVEGSMVAIAAVGASSTEDVLSAWSAIVAITI